MKMIDVANAARGRWPGILTTLGVDPKFLKNVHGPCPFDGGKDRFRFSDDGEGRWICNQCGHGDGFDLLVKINNWTLTKAKEEVGAVAGACTATPVPARDEDAVRKTCARLWREAKPLAEGDPAWLYLLNRIGQAEPFARKLRLHPALKHMDGGIFPALLAQMANPDGSKCVGLKRIWLTPDGRKAAVEPAKATLGKVGTVRLGPLAERLGVAEGIETACCASLRFAIPVWAADNAHALEAWEPPEGVRSVLVCGDNDKNYTGQAAAWALARKLVRAGFEADVRIPEREGLDWADMQMAEAS